MIMNDNKSARLFAASEDLLDMATHNDRVRVASGMLHDAANFIKQNEEVIAGNLCRGDGGKFESCGTTSEDESTLKFDTPDKYVAIVHLTKEFEDDFDPKDIQVEASTPSGMFAYPAPRTREEIEEMESLYPDRNIVYMKVPIKDVRVHQVFEPGEFGKYRQIELHIRGNNISDVKKITPQEAEKRSRTESKLWEKEFFSEENDDMKQNSEVIAGNLCRSDAGKFESCGNSDSSKTSSVVSVMNPGIEKSRGERLDLPKSSRSVWLKALGEDLPKDDPNYFYHATTEDKLPSIATKGLVAGVSKPNFPAQINSHTDEVFLSGRLNDIPGEPYGAEYWSRMVFRQDASKKPVILRVSRDKLDTVNKIGNEYEYRTKSTIPSDKLEILKNGEWKSVTRSSEKKMQQDSAALLRILIKQDEPTLRTYMVKNKIVNDDTYDAMRFDDIKNRAMSIKPPRQVKPRDMSGEADLIMRASVKQNMLADAASYVRQNRQGKCKRGTFDDSNACGPDDKNTQDTIPTHLTTYQGIDGLKKEFVIRDDNYYNNDIPIRDIKVGDVVYHGTTVGKVSKLLSGESEQGSVFGLYVTNNKDRATAYASSQTLGVADRFKNLEENGVIAVLKAGNDAKWDIRKDKGKTLDSVEASLKKWTVEKLIITPNSYHMGNNKLKELISKYPDKIELTVPLPRNPNEVKSASYQEISTQYNTDLGGFHITQYKTLDGASLKVISQDKADDLKLFSALDKLREGGMRDEDLPAQFSIMKMAEPAKYYEKTRTIGVNKALGVPEMAQAIASVLPSKVDPNDLTHATLVPWMKRNALQDVFHFIMKQNYNCSDDEKVGTGPGSCGASSPGVTQSKGKFSKGDSSLYTSRDDSGARIVSGVRFGAPNDAVELFEHAMREGGGKIVVPYDIVKTPQAQRIIQELRHKVTADSTTRKGYVVFSARSNPSPSAPSVPSVRTPVVTPEPKKPQPSAVTNVPNVVTFVPAKTRDEAEKFAYDDLIDPKEREHAERWNSGEIAHTTPDKVEQLKILSYRGLDLAVANFVNAALVESKNLGLPVPRRILARPLKNSPSVAARMGSTGDLEINTIATGTLQKLGVAMTTAREFRNEKTADMMKNLEQKQDKMTEIQKRTLTHIKEALKYKRDNVGYEENATPERCIKSTIYHELAHMFDKGGGKFGQWDSPEHKEFMVAKRAMADDILKSDARYKISSYGGMRALGFISSKNVHEEIYAEAYSLWRLHDDEDLPPVATDFFKKYLPER